METGARILIVEDQPSVRALLERILSMSGYEVVTANDGAEALSVLSANNVDLIVADIMMPHMDGYQLYEKVIANPKWVRIPFVYLTARVLESDIRYGKELGVDDYLIKPVEAQDLLSVVRGKLRRAQRLERAPVQTRLQSDPVSGMLTLGHLRLQVGQYRVWLDGEPLALSNTEFRLLEHLALHATSVVPLQELIQVTHGLQTTYGEASDLLRPMVRSLRRKMGYQAGDMGCIEAVRGIGYRLISPTDSRSR
jgi:DNA-binding response OmpR family regulator